MSNRPIKPKKKYIPEVEDDHDVEYTPPGKTPKDIIIQIGVGILVVAFLMTSGLVCVLPDQGEPVQQAQTQQVDETTVQIQQYSKQLEKDPNDAVARANLGYYQGIKASGMPSTPETESEQKTLLLTAEDNLRKSLETDPNYGFAQLELGRNLLMQEKLDEAATFIAMGMKDAEGKLTSSDEKVMNEGKNQKAELLRLSSVVALQQGKSDEALAKLSEVVELKPGDPAIYIQRAQMHRQLGDKDSARKDLNIVVDIGQKTGNQQAVVIGQALLEDMDKPATQATPEAVVSPSAPATSATPAKATPVVKTTPAAPAQPQAPTQAP